MLSEIENKLSTCNNNNNLFWYVLGVAADAFQFLLRFTMEHHAPAVMPSLEKINKVLKKYTATDAHHDNEELRGALTKLLIVLMRGTPELNIAVVRDLSRTDLLSTINGFIIQQYHCRFSSSCIVCSPVSVMNAFLFSNCFEKCFD